MAVHVIKKGLDLPISGAPEQRVDAGNPVTRVALIGDDYPFMKPRMHVKEGDEVLRGQLLFEDRKAEGVRFTAPAAGKIAAVNRGERRVFQSLVIELSEAERSGDDSQAGAVTFESFIGGDPASLERQAVVDLLVESGLWTSLRQRPYSKIPEPATSCRALFVTAIDTNPLAPDPAVIVAARSDDFRRGMAVVAKLTDGPTYLCRRPGAAIEAGAKQTIQVEEFSGPHPAGLAGTHIHKLEGASSDHVVWYLGYQDVIAIGHLFESGRLDPSRVVALAGPAVGRPRLVKTRLGACVDELVSGELEQGEIRVVSGSAIYGRSAAGELWGFLGRYSNQVTALAEGRERELLGWLMPGFDVYSTVRAYASRWIGRSSFAFTTSSRGGHRAMVPIGVFERVMPLDIMPTFLLRALVMDDIERAEALGCFELDEEDLALCTFVSPGKEDFGSHLRRNLTQIWKEG